MNLLKVTPVFYLSTSQLLQHNLQNTWSLQYAAISFPTTFHPAWSAQYKSLFFSFYNIHDANSHIEACRDKLALLLV